MRSTNVLSVMITISCTGATFWAHSQAGCGYVVGIPTNKAEKSFLTHFLPLLDPCCDGIRIRISERVGFEGRNPPTRKRLRVA